MARFEEMGNLIKEVKCLWCEKSRRSIKHGKEDRYCDGETIKIFRMKCKECGRTFRVLPEFVVPYKTHGAAVVGKAVSVWKSRGSKRAAAQEAGVEPRLVRRWVKWWKIVEAVIRAIGPSAIGYESGWLEEMLTRFRYWKSATQCST